MQFQFSTLENVLTAELIEVFNSVFAGYFVKIHMNEKDLADKIRLENIVLSKSAGAFFENKLIGFILLGIENKTAYNGGTGVLPGFRGNDLTRQMYDFILAGLKAEGVYSHRLEVITENLPALGTYEKIGFQINRTLVCFKGKIAAANLNQNLEIKFLDEIERKLFSSFWNFQPSRQNSLSAVDRTKSQHKITGAFFRGKLVGYLIYSPVGRIKQFAVKKEFRRLGTGQTLFEFARSELKNKEFVITNIDKSDVETVSFLNKIGLKPFLEQFEMKLNQ